MSEREQDLTEALRASHEAIDALIHCEQNPTNERLAWKASDLVTTARLLKRAVLARETGK